jgi:ankyrin repeat protein
MWASGEGHLEICKYLVNDCGVNINDLKGKDGMKRHALHWAGRNGKIIVASWLVLEKNVDVDVPTEDGTTPLHFAAYNGQLEMCAWLITTGHCDLNRLNAYGCNASQWWYNE